MNPAFINPPDQSKHGFMAMVWNGVLRPHGLVVVVYVAATAFTGASFMGDTADYVESILTRVEFWEFGHLAWRPLGWIVFKVLQPVVPSMAAGNPQTEAVFALIAINWATGLAAVFLMRSWVFMISKREWVATVAALALIFSHAFLNFSQTGSSYIPGLMFLLLSLHLLASASERRGIPARRAFLAGAAFAGSAAMWFPYVVVIPAALLSPLFLFGFDKRNWSLTVKAALGFTLAITIAYAAVLAHLGIYSPGGFRDWAAAASHGITTGGPSRVVLGLGRSFINMGNDGVVFKRYTLHDPFNPVSFTDLFRLSLWKLGFFYAFLCAVLLNLLRSPRGRRVLMLLVLGALPLFIFAVKFDGGAVERYLPLYPLIFLAFSCSLLTDRSRPSLKYTALAFVIAASIANVGALANPVLNAQQAAAARRVADILPLLERDTRLAVVSQQDELLNFRRAFPFNPINRDLELRVYAVVSVNTAQAATWREDFAALVLSDWERGSAVWVSKRALSPRPLAAWNWVEGDDPRVGWNDINVFFSGFEFQDPASNEDGFVLLVESPGNKRQLETITKGSRQRAA